MDNRSGILFSECWVLCPFLLLGAPARMMMFRGGWVVSRGPGTHSSRCQDRGTSTVWQDKVGGFDTVFMHEL